MIDTLARHMAALSEARRLTGMVLANNGTFGLWQRAVGAGDGRLAAQYETELSGDKAYQAYHQLGLALAEVQPRATAPGHVESGAAVRLVSQISVLSAVLSKRRQADAQPCGDCAGGMKDDAVCCGDGAAQMEPVAELDRVAMDAEVSLGARLNRVLEMTAMAQTEAAAPVWAPQRDEARVAIVYKEPPPAPLAAGEAQRPRLVCLFR